MFVTTYNLILPAISVEKDNAENVSGLYLEDAEGIDDDQNTLAEPDLDDRSALRTHLSELLSARRMRTEKHCPDQNLYYVRRTIPAVLLLSPE